MSDWVWLACLLGSNAMMLLAAHLRYKHGIWDGAFNQFLPHVQKAMREYDPHRAEEKLKRCLSRARTGLLRRLRPRDGADHHPRPAAGDGPPVTDPDDNWGEWLRPFATMADDIDLSDEYHQRVTQDMDSVTVMCPALALRRLRTMFEVLGRRDEPPVGGQCIMLSADDPLH
jgi:hypothetical protein